MQVNRAKAVAVAAPIALLLAACTSDAQEPQTSQDQLSQILDSGEIRIGVQTDAPPWGVQDSDGEYRGYDIDIANALAESLGVQAEFVAATNANRVPLIETNKVDVLIASLSATNERAQVVAMSDPYAVSAHGFMIPAGSEIESYDDISGATVATTSGSLPAEILSTEFPEANADLYSNVADSVQAIESGKADALMESQAVIAQLIEDTGDKYELLDGDPIRPGFASFGVQQGSEIWLNYLNTFIRNYINSPAGQESSLNWFGTDVTEPIR